MNAGPSVLLFGFCEHCSVDKLAADMSLSKEEAAGVRCRVIKGVKRAICLNIGCTLPLLYFSFLFR